MPTGSNGHCNLANFEVPGLRLVNPWHSPSDTH